MSQFNAGEVFTDVSPGKTVTSTRLNNHVNGATLLNGAILDQTEKTVPISADTLLLGDSTLASSAAPKKVQIGKLLLQSQRDGTQRWGGVAGGTANALTITTSPASDGAYVSGEVIRLKTGASANSGAVTINVDGRGVVNLYRHDAVALISGDLPANSLVEAVYDGTQFLMVRLVVAGQTLTSYMATENFRGGVQQYIAGSTSGANAYTAAPLDSSGAALFTSLVTGQTVRFKASASNTGAATLAVNGLAATAIKKIVAGAAADLLANDIQTGDVVEVVYDGTYYKLTGRVRSWDFVSAGTTALPGSSAAATIAHGLGAVPSKFEVRLVLTVSSDNGYSVGDEVKLESLQNNSNSNQAFAVSADATNITVAQINNSTLGIIGKTGGSFSSISANWKLKAYASL